MELFSINSEQSVIGALLLDGDKLDSIQSLLPAHFYSHESRTIFSCMKEMSSKGQPIDVVTVADSLGKDLADIGGIMYLGELAQNTPGSYNISTYAKTIIEKAKLRGLVVAGQTISDLAKDSLPLDQKIDQAQAAVMKLSEDVQTKEPMHIGDILKTAIESVERRTTHQMDGMRTNLRDLDLKLSGLHNGDLVIIAARPAMGKSTLAMQIAFNAAESGKPALFLSQEMSYQQLADRLISSAGRVDMGRLIEGRLEAEDWDRIAVGVSKLHELPLYVDDQGALTLHSVCSKARAQKRKHGIGLLVIDYLQLMSGNGDNRNSEIEVISRGLKALAKELHIPIIALSQLSRSCETRPNKRPMLSDLRDSGAIEQDADVVMFIYRDELYNPDTQEKGIGEILIRKNRQGKTGDLRMVFNGENSRFDDLAHGYTPPEVIRKNRAANDL